MNTWGREGSRSCPGRTKAKHRPKNSFSRALSWVEMSQTSILRHWLLIGFGLPQERLGQQGNSWRGWGLKIALHQLGLNIVHWRGFRLSCQESVTQCIPYLFIGNDSFSWTFCHWQLKESWQANKETFSKIQILEMSIYARSFLGWEQAQRCSSKAWQTTFLWKGGPRGKFELYDLSFPNSLTPGLWRQA